MTTTMPPIVTVTTGPPTARHLLDSGRCSGLCLMATSSPRACRCGCAGEYHGRLLDAAVSVEAERPAA